MDYLKVAQSCEYANLSKSTLKRTLKDILQRYALTPDDTPELIQEKTNEVRKVERGDLYHWEYSIELLNKIKKPLKIRSEEKEPSPEPEKEPKKLNEPTSEVSNGNEVASALVLELGEKNRQIAELHQLLSQAHRLLASPKENNQNN